MSPEESADSAGFTIIEVLIVLAIAGLILLIVFMAVPALQRTHRNLERKHFVSTTAAELDQYASNNNFAYPSTPPEICAFFHAYLEQDAGGEIGACPSGFSSQISNGVTASCVLIKTNTYDICFQDYLVTPHSYVPPVDQISIIVAHWCNRGSGYFAGDSGKPITNGGSGPHLQLQRVAVWTQLENAGTVCVDNNSSP